MPPHVPELNFNNDADRLIMFGHRTTVDGRIRVEVDKNNVKFRLTSPESLANDKFLALQSGYLQQALRTLPAADVVGDPSDFKGLSSTVCDAPVQPNGDDSEYLGRRYSVRPIQNPTPCPGQTDKDCYEFWVIVAATDHVAGPDDKNEIWGRRATVKVV